MAVEPQSREPKLKEQSGKIEDFETGTHGRDKACCSVVATHEFPGFKLIQFRLRVLSVYTYLLISSGEALLIDPVREISFYLETAKKEGAKIKGVYVTHSHADFVAGGDELPARFAILLLSRYDKSAEASKEAALDWIDDAEEMLIEQLAASANTDNWYTLRVSGRPRRDVIPQFYGRWRTSQILINMEKK